MTFAPPIASRTCGEHRASFGALQRGGEPALPPAAGLDPGQLRPTIPAECGRLVLIAGAPGLLVGIGHGWAGAHAVPDASPGTPSPLLVGAPWPLVATAVAGGALPTLIACLLPARRAGAVCPAAAPGAD